MPQLENITTYLRAHAQELGDRILESLPPLHAIDDPPSPLINKLLQSMAAVLNSLFFGDNHSQGDVDFDDRAELLAAASGVYYVTEHYADYGETGNRRDVFRHCFGRGWIASTMGVAYREKLVKRSVVLVVMLERREATGLPFEILFWA